MTETYIDPWQPAPKPCPIDLLRIITETDYSTIGSKINSRKTVLPNGVRVSSNCYINLLGTGRAFSGYIKFLYDKERVPMTFHVFSTNVLKIIIKDELPHRLTLRDLRAEYKKYIIKCKMWK